MSSDRRTGLLTDALAQRLSRPIFEAAEKAALGISVSVVDQDVVRRIYVSDTAAEILGYPVEELIGSPTFRSLSPEETARMEELRRRWRLGEPIPPLLDSVVIRKDGKQVPVEIAYSEVELDGKPATVAFLRDITEKRRHDEALRKSEERFRKLIEAAPEAITVSCMDKIVYGNPRFLEMLGYDDLEEMSERHVELIHPDDRAGIPERVQHLLETPSEAPSEPREYRLVRKDGRVVSVECVSLAIEFEGAPGFLTFLRDVTKRKETQAQRIQTDRMATVGTLAASVAHELNNPLAYVMLNLGLFEREIDSLVERHDDRVRMKERVRILQEGAQHMASIVQGLRGFCRADTPPRPVDVRRVLESAVNMASSEIAGRARIECDLVAVGPVVADEARLGQVFLNLLLNAVQAVGNRGSSTETIRVLLRPHGTKQVMIAISDSGPGIAPDLINRIFEPFFTTKPPGIGTGLGLSISKSIIDGMAGQLIVESHLGRGSTFRVVLPAASNDARLVPEACAAIEPRASHADGRIRLLIVDDEAAFAAALQRTLEAEYEVVAVTSGARALELLLDGASFDVILCDVFMPGTSGIDLHGELERRRPDIAPRMIFMSGADCMPIAAEFFARVQNARVEKPIHLPGLTALIHEAGTAYGKAE